MARRRKSSLRRPRKFPVARARSYGMVTRNNPLPLLLAAGGAIVVGFLGYQAYSAYKQFTKPTVVIGSGIGAIIGYRYGKGFWERLTYTSVGAATGLLIDRYLFPEE